MYCIKCGVKLAASEKKCPLCGTVPYHPELVREEGQPLYPNDSLPPKEVRPKAVQAVVLVLFLMPLLITLLCDLRINRTVTWSGYVIGALVVSYVVLALPGWFEKANPVVFVPCGFAAVGLYLLYINLTTDGNWFLSFAFPLVGGVGLIITAMVTLLRYVRRGQLYVLGGGAMAFGLFAPVVEFLLNLTFNRSFVGWSIYPLVALVLLGGLLIYLAINKAARETMERKLFI